MNLGALNGYAVNGSSLDANVRSAVLGECYALGSVLSTYLAEGARRFRVRVEAEAQATIFPRIMSRSAATWEARADASIFPRLMRRAVVDGSEYALLSHVPTIYYLHNVRVPLYVHSDAESSPRVRLGWYSVNIDGVCFADAVVTPRFGYRSIVNGTGEAIAYIADETAIYYKWDAPSDTGFIVPYINNQFSAR